VVENNLTAIFAKSEKGGLYIGVEEDFDELEYHTWCYPGCGCENEYV